jgi:hypothetical protein
LFTGGFAVLLWIGMADLARADSETLYSSKYGRGGSEVTVRRVDKTIVSIQYYDPCGRLREDREFRDYSSEKISRITYYSPGGTSELIVDFNIGATAYAHGPNGGAKHPISATLGNKIIDEWLHEPYPPCPHPKTTGGVKQHPPSSSAPAKGG